MGAPAIKDCTDNFTADALANIVPPKVVRQTERTQRDSLDSSERNSDARDSMFMYQNTAAWMLPQTYDISSKSLNKRVLKQSGNGSLENYRCTPDENVNITSTNRGFPTKTHAVGTKEQIEGGLSYLYPKRIEERD